MSGFHVEESGIKSFSRLLYAYGDDVGKIRKYLLRHQDELTQSYSGMALSDIVKHVTPSLDALGQLINDVTTCYQASSDQLSLTADSYDSTDRNQATELDNSYPSVPK